MARPRKGEEKNRPIHLGFKVTEEVNAALRQIADERGVPMSDIAHDALVAYLKRFGAIETRARKEKAR